MATVWIPALLRSFTHGEESIPIQASTLQAVIDTLETKYPGIKARLCDGNDLRPGLAVIIDGQLTREGLSAEIKPDSEVHFIPAIGGGQWSVARGS